MPWKPSEATAAGPGMTGWRSWGPVLARQRRLLQDAGGIAAGDPETFRGAAAITSSARTAEGSSPGHPGLPRPRLLL